MKVIQDLERVVDPQSVVTAAADDDVRHHVDKQLQHRTIELVGDELGNVLRREIGEQSSETVDVAPLQGVVSLNVLVVGCEFR